MRCPSPLSDGVSTISGSTASIIRLHIETAESFTMNRMATVIPNPTSGSRTGNPRATPMAPPTTASEVKPSVRACCPSATRAALPIFLPTRMRNRATSSFPKKPTTPAAATHPTFDTSEP